MDQEVNYDKLAPTYDQRYTAEGLSGVAQAIHGFVDLHQPGDILEVGCGTGHWLTHITQPGPRCFGLDLSRGMLQQAQTHQPELLLVQGSASRLSFADQSFDWIYCVYAIHHFSQPERFVSEAYRLLRQGGFLTVIGSDPHNHRDQWYVYEFFPGAYETDLARFPDEPDLVNWFTQSGFQGFQGKEVEQISEHYSGKQVLNDPFLQKSSCSQLALLSDEEYSAGLAHLEGEIKEADLQGTELEFRTELTIFMWTGFKS